LQPTEALTVTQLTRIIKERLETPDLSRIWVVGEVTDLSISRAGHTYFSLKDISGVMLPCTLFAGYAKGLTFRLENGAKVVVLGSVTVYEKRGAYQLNAMKVIAAGEGELALKLKQLKEKLQKEGLFDSSRKRPVPARVESIGLITSPQGAAIRDFLKMVRDIPTLSVVLYPSSVQGADAPATLIRALRYLGSRPDVDVIVLTRGGGSEEDLFCFNDEALAREIAACPVPVISAVGHEKDVPISDLVADLRLPTPTAAGRFFREQYMDAVTRVAQMRESLVVAMRRFRDHNPETVKFQMLVSRFRDRLDRFLPERIQSVDDLSDRLLTGIQASLRHTEARFAQLSRRLHPAAMRERVDGWSARLAALRTALPRAMDTAMREREARLRRLTQMLNAVNPLHVLERGFTATFDRDGKRLIRSVDQLTAGDTVQTRFVDGFALSHVVYTEKKKES